MKKIDFPRQILPHLIAIIVFFLVTVVTFNPVFFDNRALNQGDITQWEGSSKYLRDFRKATGEEGLWVPSMFSGMPAYLVNLRWSDGPVAAAKKVLTAGLPHPVGQVFLAFACYYIMLLTFGVRPLLSVAGALAFGLSSFMIIGMVAGHNARVGAIAFMPLVMAGVHLAFSGRGRSGFAVTALGMALHLRENHLQMTYYLIIIVVAYGLVQLTVAIRHKQLVTLGKPVALLVPAVLLGASTSFGQFWAISEYSQYSIRGPSEIGSALSPNAAGLSRDYAFEYSNGILEPLTLIIPNFYGGSSSDYLVNDPESETRKALTRANNQQQANQLAQLSSAYWGPQFNTAPYYAGAIIVFLFLMGILIGEKKYVIWLLPISVLAVMMSWGSSFAGFNYLLFDLLPGYNKFRSVTFAIVIALFSMPLLGMLGLEKLLSQGVHPFRKRLLIALLSTAGLCFLLLLTSGLRDYSADTMAGLPDWFARALRADRKALFVGDAWRSLGFITFAFAIIYFDTARRWGSFAFGSSLALLVILDVGLVDRRFLSSENYRRKREQGAMLPTAADAEILKDKSIYRVYNLQGTMAEAHTSYYHLSVGGYHGAKIRRYQDLYDSCLLPETNRFISDARSGTVNFPSYGIMNMLNIKYIVFGPDADSYFTNTSAPGHAWFVNSIIRVKSPTDELARLRSLNTKETAVIDETRFKVSDIDNWDSLATVRLTEFKPNYLKYEANSTTGGLVVFSEIFYPKGWLAEIDGVVKPILRANYVLRALELPAGNHVIEFKFQPDPYGIGNKITQASSWILILVVLGSFGLSITRKKST